MKLAPNFEKIGGVRYEAVGHKHQEGKISCCVCFGQDRVKW